MSFPSLKTRKSEKTDEWAKGIIDAAIESHRLKTARRERISKNFRTYNGGNLTLIKNNLIKKYGKQLTTQFKAYRLGRSKVELLKGEFLDIDIKKTVTSTSPETVSKKAERYKTMRGAMAVKDDVEKVKEYGINPLGGAEIPEPNDENIFAKLHPKTKNEVFMQAIIDDKAERLHMKMQFLECMLNIILSSECHGKIVKDRSGEDVFMPLDPRDVIFEENQHDPTCSKTPYSGDVEYLYPEEILLRHPEINKKTQDKIKELDNSDIATLRENNIHFEVINGKPAFPVYTLQWLAINDDFTKISPDKNSDTPYLKDIDQDDYYKNEKKYKEESESGKYEIQHRYREEVWEGHRINEDIYFGIQIKEDGIQTINSLNKYSAHTDYIHMLYNTVNGVRIPPQEIFDAISEMYDEIMFAMRNEIRKMKGKVTIYDKALKPGDKSMTKILYDLYEHSIMEINSSEAGWDNEMLGKVYDFMKELDLGLSQSFGTLLELKRDLEYTLDKISGINESREGTSKPTMTATGVMQNVEASRSQTRDIYFFMDIFVSMSLTKLAERTRINEEFLEHNATMLYGDDIVNYISHDGNIKNDSFAITIGDGKKELELRKEIKQYFPLEINASNLRTMDIIRFTREKNINKAIAMLDSAYEKMQQIKREEMAQRSDSDQKKLANARQMAIEDREDKQQHEKEMEVMQGDIDLKKIREKGNQDRKKEFIKPTK